MKNIFIKIITFSICMSVLANSLSYGMINASAEENAKHKYSNISARGVWHRPNSSGRETTLEGLCSVLDEMSEAGINMVFLETFYHGMTVFKTNLVPYYTGFEKYDYGEYPDYLTAFSAEAHKRGIEVHAWVESFYLGVNENTALVKYFPNWLLINESGRINHTTEGAELGGYIFLDPANPAARDYLLKFYDELLTKIPYIDGLNLDYIRYPISDFYSGTDTGYTDVSMSEFAEKHGLSINENNKYQNFKAQIREKSLVDDWTDYRAQQVTTFVKQVSEMVNESHRECIISVAIHPDISNAYSQKKQDFVTWVENGYIDVVTPMVYYYNSSQISYALKEMLPKFENVYCYSGLYTTYHNQSTSELEAHIKASNDCGADGFVLFESVKTFFTPSDDYAEFLSEKYRNDQGLSALPHWNTERLVNASSEIIAQNLSNNGESEELIKTVTDEMERISQIGEKNVENLDLTVDEIIKLRDHILSESVSSDSASDAKNTLNMLIEYLEVRKSRLSFKGYISDFEEPEDGNNEGDPSTDGDNDKTDDGENSKESNTSTPTDNEGPSSEKDTQPKGFFGIIKSIIDSIINWFKNLFSK